MGAHMHIGEVADRTGLSLRTIRYYDEVGVVTPSSRTEGGFRLYTEDDVEQLELVKQMKPLEYSLSEMREVLEVVAALEAAPSPARREQLVDQLATIRATAVTRREKLAAKLAAAEGFLARLDEHARPAGRRR